MTHIPARFRPWAVGPTGACAGSSSQPLPDRNPARASFQLVIAGPSHPALLIKLIGIDRGVYPLAAVTGGPGREGFEYYISGPTRHPRPARFPTWSSIDDMACFDA